jgi:hypothetical protein
MMTVSTQPGTMLMSSHECAASVRIARVQVGNSVEMYHKGVGPLQHDHQERDSLEDEHTVLLDGL